LHALSSHATPKLESDTSVSTAGYYQLHWVNGKSGDFVLQESASPNFSNVRTLYQGPDTATLISGRRNGSYYYRVENTSSTGDWSNAVEVKVAHHPLSRALMFFSLGALVFIATLTIVIRGNLAHKNNAD